MGFDVKDKVAIVTGSARGFGKEFAIRLLQKGAKVCISDVNENEGKETLKELEKQFGAERVIFQRLNQLNAKLPVHQIFQMSKRQFIIRS